MFDHIIHTSATQKEFILSIQVSITKGYYRGKVITGTFALVKPWQDGAKGGFLTIRNPDPEPGTPPVQRVNCEKGDFTLLDAAGVELGDHVVIDTGENGGKIEVGTDYEAAFVQAETEDEAMDRIEETFAMLDKITEACTRNVIRGLVVSGPPGIGKSFGVEKQLEAANMFRTIAGKDPKYEVISGGVSSIGLYQKLYFNRSPEQVLVFDDCDGVLFEEECLNLLKAALNSGDKRRICWNKESRTLSMEGIPEVFDFEGSIIFLSNIDFEKTIAKGSRISAHLEAIMSRCHYLDLEIGSLRDKLLRIKQIVRDGMLAPYLFSPAEEQAVIDFVMNNSEYLREVSLRMVKKVADFVKADPVGWLEMAEATCLQRDAKFKRLLEKRQKEAARRGLVLAEQ
jgi:hypothetical protein